MTEQRGVIHQISWRDLCPWLAIVRGVGLAFSMRVLVIAALGASLTPVGWQLGDWLFRPAETASPDSAWAALVAVQTRWPSSEIPPWPGNDPQRLQDLALRSPQHLTLGYRRLLGPALYLFDMHLTWRQLAWLLFGLGWSIFVWALFGGTIARMAVMHLGPEEPVGATEAWRFAVRHAPGQILAPISPTIGIVGLTALLALVGLLLRIPGSFDVDLILVGLGWGLALLVGLGLAWLVAGLLYGWPLMWGTIATEGSDAFDAMARSYSYPVRRPLHTLAYVLIAVAVGSLAWLWVYAMAELTIYLTWWAVGWGAGPERLAEIQIAMYDTGQHGTTTKLGALLLGCWVAVVRTFVVGFSYAWLWCSAAAIYLLLRLAVDGRETDEVFREAEAERYRLAAMGLDSASLAAALPQDDSPSPASEPAGDSSSD